MEDYEIITIISVPLGTTALIFLFASFSGWKIKEFETWQLILASLHLSLAVTMYVLTGVADDPWTVPVELSYNRWEVNDLGDCSKDTPCTIYVETDDIGDFKTTYLVPVYSLISGLHHLFAAVSLKSGSEFYKNQVLGGINLVRWLDYALSSSLMLVVLEILFLSPPDIRMLVFTAFIQIFIIMAGYASDVARSQKLFGHAFTLFGLACIIYTAYFSTQWYLFYKGTSISDAPSVVYIFVGYVSFTFSLFAAVQGYFTYKEKTQPNNKEEIRTKQEVWFSFLSFFSKIPLLMTFYFGLTTRSSSGIMVGIEGVTTTTTSSVVNDDTDRFLTYLPFLLTTIFCIILGSIMIYIGPELKPNQTVSGKMYSRL